MNRARKVTGLTSLTIFATAGSALACVGDGSTGSCQCASKFTLGTAPVTTSPAATALSLPGSTRGATPGGAPNSTQLVHVFNFDFSTNVVGMPIMDATISVGDSVHWVWDSGVHSVTTVAGSTDSFDSGIFVAPSGAYDHTFTRAGVFNYFCTLHGFDNGDGSAGGMAGTITVVGSSPSTWNVDADGSWGTATNWAGGVPDGVDAQAVLGGAISQPRTVTVDTARTLGQLTLDNSNRYTIAGTGTLNIDVASGSGTIASANGSHTIATAVALAKNTNVSVSGSSSVLTISGPLTTAAGVTLTKTGGGSLEVRNVRVSTLALNTGAVRVTPDGTSGGASNIATLTLAAGATLDLSDNDLIATATSKAFVAQQIAAARNGGTWNQPGITSSSAKAQASHATTLGVLGGAEFKSVAGALATFNGFSVADGDTLVKYTWYGDTDFNGRVNFDDYVRTDNGFNNHLSGWLNGDFDGNNTVNFDDYVLIDLAFNTQSGTLGRALGFLGGSDSSRNGMSDPALRQVQQHLSEF